MISLIFKAVLLFVLIKLFLNEKNILVKGLALMFFLYILF